MLSANSSIAFELYILIPEVGSVSLTPVVSLIASAISLLPSILKVKGFFFSRNLSKAASSTQAAIDTRSISSDLLATLLL